LAVFLGSRSEDKVSMRCMAKRGCQLTLVNVGQDTTLGDCDVTEQLVQLLIVSDGQLKVTGDDTGLLVVTSSVASQLKDFGGEVLKNCSEVDGSTSTDTLSIVALSQETVDTTNGKGETGLGGSAVHKLLVIWNCKARWTVNRLPTTRRTAQIKVKLR
jgi:hypothetical protein